jgi:hypothetical protein
MQWSKLKSRIKALICPELHNRIDFHVTRYREPHGDAGEAWITVDGKKIFGASYHRFLNEEHEERSTDQPDNADTSGWRYFGDADAYVEIAHTLHEREIHDSYELVHALHSYLDLSVQDALKSENPYIRALAIVDRRIGKRTLDKLNIAETDHSLVRSFYALRTQPRGTTIDSSNKG